MRDFLWDAAVLLAIVGTLLLVLWLLARLLVERDGRSGAGERDAAPPSPGRPITAEEGEYILDHALAQEPACPDCRRGDLIPGPAMEDRLLYRCERCGARFLLAFLPGPAVVGSRLPDERKERVPW